MHGNGTIERSCYKLTLEHKVLKPSSLAARSRPYSVTPRLVAQHKFLKYTIETSFP